MRAAPQWCLTAWHTGPIGSAWLIDIRLRFPIDSLPGESIDPLFGAALRMRGLYQAESPKQELQELRCRAMLDRNFPFNELELDPALLGELMQTLNSGSVTLQGPECFPENDADMNHLRLSYGSSPGAHVQRLRGQPHRVDADHRSSSRIQAAQCSAASTGQVTFTQVP